MDLKPKYRLRRAQDASLGTAVRRMLELISPHERRRLWFLVPVITVNALAQVFGIVSVMPFLGLIASPGAVADQAVLAWAYETFGFQSADSFIIFVGFGVLVILLVSNAIAAGTEWMMLRFSWFANHTLSLNMLRIYLAKPYAFFLDQNSSGLAKNILGEVRQAITGFLVAAMNLVARGFVVVALLVLLFAVEPLLALATFGILGLAYGGIYVGVQRGMTESGRKRSMADRARYKAATEALSGVKEIKLLGMESAFLRRYEEPSSTYARQMARQQVISTLPRYALESIAFGGMLIIILYSMMRGIGVAAFLPTLGIYALATYRLLPALQGVFGALTHLRFSVVSVELLHQDFEASARRASSRDDGTPIRVMSQVELQDVTFAYPNAQHPVLQDFDLRIQANTTVALVGSTGAGKTTVIDLLLGLLRPQVGHLVVDGVAIDDENVQAWQRSLGYVPQEIYLVDDTVAANIAFGVPGDEIDMGAVELAAKRANIHDFIVQELTNGYATEVGERGVRLSGGQRQRLGIARALFHDPDVLILDEATSALDSVTEESIFQSVREIGRNKTVIMIAHRISTVRACDRIFVLERGRVVAGGEYDDLIGRSPEFRALARVANDQVGVAS